MGKVLKNEFAWSKSRMDTFDGCRRRYWFNYYGSWNGWLRTAPKRARDIYILKQLQNRWGWPGARVHEAIERVIKALKSSSQIPKVGDEIQSLTKQMRQDFRFSRDKCYWTAPKGGVALAEHEYGPDPGSDTWAFVVSEACRCLEAFFDSTVYPDIVELSPDRFLEIEDFSHFYLDGLKVWVVMDLCFRRPDDKVVIVDWKTGKAKDPDPVQLSCYALYAKEKWGLRPGDIEVCEYNLKEGRPATSTITEGMLLDVRRIIETSAEGMTRYVVDGDRAKNTPLPEDDFEAIDTGDCRRCNFRRLCPVQGG